MKLTIKNVEINKKHIAIIFLILLSLVLYTLIICRTVANNLSDKYEEQYANFKKEFVIQETERYEASKPVDPLQKDAEYMAMVLYGVRYNNSNDLKTICWCILNRVDNSQYPNTIAEVVMQDKQWMGFDVENPVIDNLYEIAYNEISIWHNNEHRPVSNDYIYMDWSPNEITLRNEFEATKSTKYWKYD